MLIDAHHHLWKYSAQEYPWISDKMAVLKHDFWSDQLQQTAAANQVDGFVTVQARQSLSETETLLELAASQSLIKGVVGWVDFASDQITDQLDRFSGHSKLKGLRHVVQDEPDDRFILGSEFNRGISAMAGRNLVYDLLIFSRQLGPSVEFAKMHPDIPMVLDHIAKPRICGTVVDPDWESGIRQLAELPNIACKFSGIATEVVDPSWDIATIRPYWDIVLDAFTPSRLMYGSDWPVCLLRTQYSQWIDTARQLAGELSVNEQDEFFGATARRLYHLE